MDMLVTRDTWMFRKFRPGLRWRFFCKEVNPATLPKQARDMDCIYIVLIVNSDYFYYYSIELPFPLSKSK